MVRVRFVWFRSVCIGVILARLSTAGPMCLRGMDGARPARHTPTRSANHHRSHAPFPACHSPLPFTTYHCGVGLLFAFVSSLCAGFSLLRIPAQNGRAVIADSCPTAMCIIPHPNTLCACMSYICTTPGTCMQIRTRHDVSCTPKRHHFSWRAQNGRTRPSVRSLQQH